MEHELKQLLDQVKYGVFSFCGGTVFLTFLKFYFIKNFLISIIVSLHCTLPTTIFVLKSWDTVRGGIQWTLVILHTNSLNFLHFLQFCRRVTLIFSFLCRKKVTMGEGNAWVHLYFKFSLNHLIIDTHIFFLKKKDIHLLFIKKKNKKILIYHLLLFSTKKKKHLLPKLKKKSYII